MSYSEVNPPVPGAYKALLARHRAKTVKISLGAFGSLTQKNVELCGTWPGLSELAHESRKRSGPVLLGSQLSLHC